jgi:hypothetical protein
MSPSYLEIIATRASSPRSYKRLDEDKPRIFASRKENDKLSSNMAELPSDMSAVSVLIEIEGIQQPKYRKRIQPVSNLE